jgi:Fe-S-cluster containining protein
MSHADDLADLRRLYAETDSTLAGWGCEDSADCCHFARTGREPYLWPIELALLEKAIAARGVKKKSLQVIEEDDRACPLLGRDQRCTVYAARPFGCRTFFCERGCGPARRPPRDQLAELGRRIATLAQRAAPDCDGPRPISTLLASLGQRR